MSRPGSAPRDQADAIHKRVVIAISAATGSTSALVSVWFPFLPLFLLQVGAKDEAAALFWVGIGMSAQGVGRLLGGPLWGMLSDRFGRKKMFVRSVYSAALTSFMLSVINSPWQLAIGLFVQGFFSGFIPAAVALTSVSVPDAKVKDALNAVSGGQYLGSAIGPAAGATMAIAMGYRGTLFSAGVLLAAVASAVIYLVPADSVRRTRRDPAGSVVALEPFRPTPQFALAMLVYFALFALATFRSVATPIVLKDIAGANVTAVTGLAFTLGSIASALGIWALSTRYFSTRRVRSLLVVFSGLAALGHLMLALADSVWLYVLAFTVASLLNAAMMPASNTLIALNASRERRGTAFGIASAAQAFAFMAGPMGAALFATTSLQTGFVAVSLLLAALAVLIGFAVREPAAKH